MSSGRPPATLIYNPRAGRRRHGRSLEAIRSILGAAYSLEVAPTAGARDAIGLARRAAERGDRAVFAWGGDGTIREVAEGILGSPSHLGILPGGTFNVVARAMGLTHNPVVAAARLAKARPQPRDVGLMGSTPFLMQATAGLDGFLMHHMRADLKARFGMGGVVIDSLRALRHYGFTRFRVDVDGVEHDVTGAALVNITEYAGLYPLVPGARWDDRKAHVFLYHGTTRLAAILFAIDLGLGRHHRRRDVLIKEASRMTILPSPNVYAQTDGDPWRGDLPVTCRLADERLQILIPSVC